MYGGLVLLLMPMPWLQLSHPTDPIPAADFIDGATDEQRERVTAHVVPAARLPYIPLIVAVPTWVTGKPDGWYVGRAAKIHRPKGQTSGVSFITGPYVGATAAGEDVTLIGPGKDPERVDGLPFSIDAMGNKGRSGGLAMALATYQALAGASDTPAFGATGAILDDGTVYPVTGAETKAVAVEEAGIEFFLVPRDNVAEAERRTVALTVVPIDTFDDAVAWLDSM